MEIEASALYSLCFTKSKKQNKQKQNKQTHRKKQQQQKQRKLQVRSRRHNRPRI